jgi:SAM-dependent methyltransferase
MAPKMASSEAVSARGLLRGYGARYGARKAANFDFELRNTIFDRVLLDGATVLDVGCGDGRMGMWAATHGARRVVGLEPEIQGSSGGMQKAFRCLAREAAIEDRVELVTTRLQDYDPGTERFDVLLLAASINHLDEPACMRLDFDEDARQTFRRHFRHLADLAAPGAALVVTDVDRRNVFSTLRVTNPFSPTIEWEKHQSPFLWARLLNDVGFESPDVKWSTFNTLRRPGQRLLDNYFAAYLTISAFRLHMRRGP